MTQEDTFAREKASGYPSAMPVTGQQDVVTTQDSGQQDVITQQVTVQPQDAATQETGQAQVTTTPQVEYAFDWGSGMSIKNAYDQGTHSLQDIIDDRRKWGKANNNPIDYFDVVDALPDNHDRTKTKAQNEDAIRKAERKAKFDRIGNFLTHLGNFVGAVGFGGLDIKPEDAVKLSERQQRLKDKTEALRSAYNKDWFNSAYKQMAADRQAELDKANAEHKATQDELARRKQEDLERRTAILEFNAQVNKEFKDAKTRNDERITEIKVALAQGQINLNQARAALTNIKASVEAGGKTVEKRNADGSVTVTTTTPNTNGKRTLPNRVKKTIT